jgi:hypothetical protein
LVEAQNAQDLAGNGADATVHGRDKIFESAQEHDGEVERDSADTEYLTAAEDLSAKDKADIEKETQALENVQEAPPSFDEVEGHCEIRFAEAGARDVFCKKEALQEYFCEGLERAATDGKVGGLVCKFTPESADPQAEQYTKKLVQTCADHDLADDQMLKFHFALSINNAGETTHDRTKYVKEFFREIANKNRHRVVTRDSFNKNVKGDVNKAIRRDIKAALAAHGLKFRNIRGKDSYAFQNCQVDHTHQDPVPPTPTTPQGKEILEEAKENAMETSM